MYYCGVCKSIGRNFGQLSRFGLVNETAILSLILSMASGNINTPDISVKGCIAHPYKKSSAVINSDAADYSAAINVLLIYFKLQDNWQDDKNIAAAAAKKAICNGFKKASRKYPIASDSVFFSIRNLNLLEKNKCENIDEASEPFALMMSDIFKWKDSDIFCSSPQKLDLLGKMGYNVGKWIYLIDAVSDINKDIKSGSYNVLIGRTDNIKFVLEMCLAECAAAWENILKIFRTENDTDNIHFINAKGVIDNLFYIGMRHITEMKAGKIHESV